MLKTEMDRNEHDHHSCLYAPAPDAPDKEIEELHEKVQDVQHP